MMIITAKRYAKALYDIANEEQCVAEILNEFDTFLTLVNNNRYFQLLLNFPYDDHKRKMIIQLFQRKFSKLFLKFILLVIKNRRYDILPLIHTELQKRAESKYKYIKCVAVSGIPLPDDDLEEMQQQLSDFFSLNVIVENKVDLKMPGGIQLHIDGQEFQNSFRDKLKLMKYSAIKN